MSSRGHSFPTPSILPPNSAPVGPALGTAFGLPGAGDRPRGEFAETFVPICAAMGLSEHEGQLFLSFAALGPSHASEAIERTGLDRATGYRALNRLESRGLLLHNGAWPRRFTASRIEQLLDRFETQITDEVETFRLLRGAVAPFLSVRRPRDAPGDSVGTRGLDRGEPPFRILGHDISPFRAIEPVLASVRESCVAVLSPRQMPSDVRRLVGRELSGLVHRDVSVRVVLDANAADRRFYAHLARDLPSSARLEARYFVPHLTHLYVLDGRLGVWVAGSPSPGPRRALSVVSRDPLFVSHLKRRFAEIWAEAVSPA